MFVHATFFYVSSCTSQSASLAYVLINHDVLHLSPEFQEYVGGARVSDALHVQSDASSHTCIVAENGAGNRMYCTGSNGEGDVGDGGSVYIPWTNHLSPEPYPWSQYRFTPVLGEGGVGTLDNIKSVNYSFNGETHTRYLTVGASNAFNVAITTDNKILNWGRDRGRFGGSENWTANTLLRKFLDNELSDTENVSVMTFYS